MPPLERIIPDPIIGRSNAPREHGIDDEKQWMSAESRAGRNSPERA
jgi:hypothetical protein